MNKSKKRLTRDYWDNHSSVRARPNTYDVCIDQPIHMHTGDWYPRAMLPFLDRLLHLKVPDDKIQRLLAQHLIYFLDYTTVLEHLMVNRSLEVIIHNQLNVQLPEHLKSAGLQIYTDEGYHALFSNQLSTQVANLFNIKKATQLPLRIESLNTYLSRATPSLKNIIYFSIGFVSETIIAKEISQITTCSLTSQANALLTDHLADEAVHAQYFAEIFKFTWAHCKAEQRDAIASALPDILKIFCLTDIRWLEGVLKEADVPNVEIAQIVERANNEAVINLRAASAAKMTFSILRKVGFFQVCRYADIFKSKGLPYA